MFKSFKKPVFLKKSFKSDPILLLKILNNFSVFLFLSKYFNINAALLVPPPNPLNIVITRN